jgi:hypothetical protein
MNFDFSQFLTWSNISMLTLVGFIAYAVWKIKKSNKDKDGEQFSLSGFFIDDPAHKFEIVATISTLCEVIGLALMAIDRGVEPFNAASRFITIGFVELMFTFLFINVTTGMMKSFFKAIYSDGKVQWHEYVTYPSAFIVFGSALFFICCIPTYIISQLYFESIGVLKFNYVNDWNPLNYLEPADVSSTFIDENGKMITTYPELGALILIWFTPLLNLMQLPLAFINIWRSAKIEGVEEQRKPKEATIEEIFSQLESLLGYKASKLLDKLEKTTDKSNIEASPKIKSGAVSKEEHIEGLRKMLLGSEDEKKPSGILGYNVVETKHKAVIKEIEATGHKKTKVDEDMKKLKAEIEKLKKDKPDNWQDDVDKKEDAYDKLKSESEKLQNERAGIRTKQKELQTQMTDIKEKIKVRLDKTNLLD